MSSPIRGCSRRSGREKVGEVYAWGSLGVRIRACRVGYLRRVGQARFASGLFLSILSAMSFIQRIAKSICLRSSGSSFSRSSTDMMRKPPSTNSDRQPHLPQMFRSPGDGGSPVTWVERESLRGAPQRGQSNSRFTVSYSDLPASLTRPRRCLFSLVCVLLPTLSPPEPNSPSASVHCFVSPPCP